MFGLKNMILKSNETKKTLMQEMREIPKSYQPSTIDGEPACWTVNLLDKEEDRWKDVIHFQKTNILSMIHLVWKQSIQQIKESSNWGCMAQPPNWIAERRLKAFAQRYLVCVRNTGELKGMATQLGVAIEKVVLIQIAFEIMSQFCTIGFVYSHLYGMQQFYSLSARENTTELDLPTSLLQHLLIRVRFVQIYKKTKQQPVSRPPSPSKVEEEEEEEEEESKDSRPASPSFMILEEEEEEEEVDEEEEEKVVFEALTFAGYVGVLSGMRPQQYALSFSAAGLVGSKGMIHTDPHTWAPGSLLRQCLENRFDFTGLELFLRTMPLTRECDLSVMGCYKTQACIVVRRADDLTIQKWKIDKKEKKNKNATKILALVHSHDETLQRALYYRVNLWRTKEINLFNLIRDEFHPDAEFPGYLCVMNPLHEEINTVVM